MKNIVGRSKPRRVVLCHFFPSVCYFREKCWNITQTACIRLCVPRQGWFLRAGKFVSDGWPESHRNSLKNGRERMDREQKISGRKKNERRRRLCEKRKCRQTSHVVIANYTGGIFTVIRRGMMKPFREFFISGSFLENNSLGLYEFRGKLNKGRTYHEVLIFIFSRIF